MVISTYNLISNIQHTIKIIEIFYFFWYCFKNSVCVLYLQHILIQTSHISNVQKPHLAGGYCIGTCRSRRFLDQVAHYFVANIHFTGSSWLSFFLFGS